MDVIYVDFSKAFDRVRHKYLLEKLAAYGVTAKLFEWIQGWLSSREMFVRVQEQLSESIHVTFGVPQGLVLGPILFLIYINDLLKNLQSQILMFADDAKVWRHINSMDDRQALQGDLNTIHNWSQENKMPLNLLKCRSLSLHSRSPHVYYIGGTAIQAVSQENYLGVILQSDLGNTSQCIMAARRAENNLGLLKRALGSFEACIIRDLIADHTLNMLVGYGTRGSKRMFSFGETST